MPLPIAQPVLRADNPLAIHDTILPTRPPATYHLASAFNRTANDSKHLLHTDSATSSKCELPVEKGDVRPWDGYIDDLLPEKTHGRLLRNVRFQLMSLYRRLFGIVFVVNVVVLVHACVVGTDALYLGQVTIANIFVAILMRQEYVVNTFFAVACAAPRS